MLGTARAGQMDAALEKGEAGLKLARELGDQKRLQPAD